MSTGQKVVVIGAGPVGALAALYAANRGDDVEIYELRGDLRDPSTTPLNFTKSINLALSERGINAMRQSSSPKLAQRVLSETLPMYGRMIHGKNQSGLFEQAQAYDVHGRAINAVDRHGLNRHLLDELEKKPNVKFFFHHKLTGADFRYKKAWLERTELTDSERGHEIEISFDLLIGADGAHSAARYHLMKYSRVSYSQEYIDTLWCEFQIPPTATNDFRISPNHLHIWPAGNFMFIAIPSFDKSFTCTLFAPAAQFADLERENADHRDEYLLQYFDAHFPGVVPDLISPEDLTTQFHSNPHLPLISIKCGPYHYKSSAVIIGDAAHASVPFYGQGMNSGLEDVRVLFEKLDGAGLYSFLRDTDSGTDKDPDAFDDELEAIRERALSSYTAYRMPDAHAVCDLSMDNYVEMRSSVRDPLYKLRKMIEEALDKYVPQLGWSTQYSRVSFSNLRYSDVRRAVAVQGQILSGAFATTFVAGLGLAALGWMKWRHSRPETVGDIVARWFMRGAEAARSFGR